MTDFRVRPGTPRQRWLDAMIHITPVVPAAIAFGALGGPRLWAVWALVLGPLLLGLILAGRRPAGREHRARAIDLNVTVAVYALGLFGVLSAGARFASLSILIPIGALGVALLAINWVLMTWIGANRARYGELFDPPWVLPLPGWFRGWPRDPSNPATRTKNRTDTEDEAWPRSSSTT